MSVFDLPASLFGTTPAAIEGHAVNTSTEPATVHVVKVQRQNDLGGDLYRLACALAESVGIDLEG